MIEAVGADHCDAYFRRLQRAAAPERPDGLQAISSATRIYESPTRQRRLHQALHLSRRTARVGDGHRGINGAGDGSPFAHYEDITDHYAETLRRWRHRMRENFDAIRALGLDEPFLAMWNYYLCYCEGGFRERVIGTIQMRLERQG